MRVTKHDDEIISRYTRNIHCISQAMSDKLAAPGIRKIDLSNTNVIVQWYIDMSNHRMSLVMPFSLPGNCSDVYNMNMA